MKKLILICILALSVPNCASTSKNSAPQLEFNHEKFTGLVSWAPGYQEIVIDYDLDNESGERLHFTSCLQVDATSESSVLTSEYHFYKLLKINCKACKLFIEKGSQAKTSYFPDYLTEKLIGEFPAEAGPLFNDEELQRRIGNTLNEYESGLDIERIERNTAEFSTDTDYITFDIMARGDFNGDGFQDLLVRSLWHVRDAFGKGEDLFILEKTSPEEPIKLTWRFTK